ncbi:50S ribosomal protein L3 N(5)-glutamine methyltransferase [Derxia lacustris]|uniref:50S ribosomal protein L3 N(5)-glutamine methyltransferase n=1 Tax=Derxia lacustris TaxID=764842 RepID=UPI000A17454F|nr:50S ribosomal protein L3 N(5)-glutamine methyltransferase [Derxia lacustris]
MQHEQARAELRTVRDLLRYAVSRFGAAKLAFGHGSATAFDEAAYLILHTLHLPIDTLDPFLDARLLPTEVDAVLNVIHRRADERVPAAYLTGEAWLGEFRFLVDERVIVPRSFIAEWLRDGFTPWIEEPASVGRVLDLCTGSGCLAIVAAHLFPNAQVDAVDISPAALEVARSNVALYGLEDRVHVVESDLFARLHGEKYNVILTNPPYVPTKSMDALPAEYRHEPALALGAGADGLDVVRRIMADAPTYLAKRGIMVVEVGHERDAVEAAWPRMPMTWLSTSAGDDMIYLVDRDALVS